MKLVRKLNKTAFHSHGANAKMQITLISVSPLPVALQFIRSRLWMWKVSPFMRTATRSIKDDTSSLRLKRTVADIASFEKKGIQKLPLMFLFILRRDIVSFSIFANVFWSNYSSAYLKKWTRNRFHMTHQINFN